MNNVEGSQDEEKLAEKSGRRIAHARFVLLSLGVVCGTGKYGCNKTGR